MKIDVFFRQNIVNNPMFILNKEKVKEFLFYIKILAKQTMHINNVSKYANIILMLSQKIF